MKYSFCIETMFDDLPIYDRVAVAKDCGADAVEIYNPALYDCKKFAALLAQHNLPMVECGLVEGWDTRLNAPIEILKNNLNRTISLGKELGCAAFTGHVAEGDIDPVKERAVLVENLKQLAEICEREDVTINIEILNSVYDSKGYLLDTTRKAAAVLDEVGSPRIKLLYDFYHTQIMEGNLIRTIQDHVNYIGHFHGSGIPERSELFLSEINYPPVIRAVENAGYQGWFGLEYWPTYDHRKSLRDVMDYLKTK